MNHCVPEWSIEEDFRSFQCLPPADNHLKPLWPQNELEELLWQNGHVVKHSQTHRKTMTSPSEIKPCQKRESTGKVGSSKSPANVVHEETAPWLQYPVEDSLEKEFCPELFYELPATESPAVEKSRDHETPERNGVFSDPVFQQSKIPQLAANVMMTHQSEFGGDRNFTNLSRTREGESAPPEGHLRGKIRLGDQVKGEVGETSSMVTKESNMCASNQVHNWFGPGYTNTEKTALAKGVEEDALTKLRREKAQTDVRETTVTSSSGGSGCTVGRAGRQSADPRIHKRKGRDVDESELHSTEEAEYESMERSRQSHRSASGRRRRAAEVHNLSERRRRDRINERMRALQELIPHCNKSDRASMLDEAIEYLKSLQLQVQIMWMRSGLAPMMFPGVHHYMPQMGMGMGMGMGMVMGHSSMPSIPFPGVPPVNIPPASSSNPTMQNAQIPTSYARYVGFQHMQPSPQMMNLFAYGAPLVQQNQAAALATSKCAPCVGEAPSENVQDGSTG